MAISVFDHSNERFGFTVFISACAHAMVILGLGFNYLEEMSNEPAMEITLAQYSSELAPEDADFLAQENQTGSGTLDERAAPSTPFTSDFNDDVIQEVAAVQQNQSARETPPQDMTVVTTVQAENDLPQPVEEELQEQDEPVSEQAREEDLSLAISSLQAQLDLQRQAYAKRPRKYTISSASTKKSHDALYLDSWRKRIESVGNLNYPEIARRDGIFGNLRLMVTLLPDGSVHEILILKSSSSAVLDQAAVDIVRLAAPFEPFPDELRGQVDLLEIIRTWRFHEGAAFTTE